MNFLKALVRELAIDLGFFALGFISAYYARILVDAFMF